MSESKTSPLSKETKENKDFRESLGTMDNKGKRVWIYPKKPKGKYYKKRTYVSYLLLTILFGIPLINYYRVEQGMNPLFQFNIIKRQFYLFGNYFQPQDLYILAIGAIATVVFIIVFTVIWGRLFCGWVCPQTIFLEMVFRKIEYAIDGDRNKQMKLARQEWNNEKIRKRVLKYSIYIALSFLISIMFLSYIIGTHAVVHLFEEGIAEHTDTFIGLLVFTGLFFFVFAWFREQACTLVCPYGRFQGVLVDKKTVTVAYDYPRGEGEKGRGSWRKKEDRKAVGKGDCIDCNQCVVVCPTGIDIRNGSNQLECVNCTACMDACDEVMEKIGLPTGLIRYASEENIEEGTKFKISTRAWAYSAVIVVLMLVFTSFLINRPLVQSSFARTPGAEFKQTENSYSNPYQYILINKTDDTLDVHLRVLKPNKTLIDTYGNPDTIRLMPRDTKQGIFKVVMPIEEYEGKNQNIVIGTFDTKGTKLDQYKISFRGPLKTF